MRHYHDYADTYIDDNNRIFTGLSILPDFRDYEYLFEEYIIKPEQEFRPDKIAWELWDAPDLHWLLDVINDFQNGVSEYTQGRTIKYLDIINIQNLGLI